MQQVTWITLDKAREITGHACNKTLGNFLWSWNKANPYCQISRMKGRVHYQTLITALDERAQQFAGGSVHDAVMNAASRNTKKRRIRANGNAA